MCVATEIIAPPAGGRRHNEQNQNSRTRDVESDDVEGQAHMRLQVYRARQFLRPELSCLCSAALPVSQTRLGNLHPLGALAIPLERPRSKQLARSSPAAFPALLLAPSWTNEC
ncbi:unnamed protein product [Cercospora beticola]|nr:unnamed protein product [Cercospora beticola]